MARPLDRFRNFDPSSRADYTFFPAAAALLSLETLTITLPGWSIALKQIPDGVHLPRICRVFDKNPCSGRDDGPLFPLSLGRSWK